MRKAVGSRIGVVTGRQASAEVYAARVGEHVAHVDAYGRDLLSAEEQARLSGYRSRESAERYVVTRALVRAVLAERMGVPPREILVSHTERGKPVVSASLHFNVSHSGDLILLAVSDDRPVGVDVERRRDVQRVQALVARWLSASERDDVRRIEGSGLALSEAFLRVWSLKEAKLKALGVGISGASAAPLDQVDAVPLDDVLESFSAGGESGYVGAIAFV